MTLSVDPDAIDEAGGVSTVTATLSESLTSDVTVDLGITGSATSGDDYTASATQIVIAAGQTSGTATVTCAVSVDYLTRPVLQHEPAFAE